MQTTVFNPDLKEAMDFEVSEAGMDIISLMAEMSGNAEEKQESVFDEMKVRRMVLSLRHLNRELNDLKRFKKAIMAEWDTRIENKKKSITEIKDVIHDYLVNKHEGKGLKLDVATISVKKVSPSFEIDKSKVPLLRAYLEDAGMLQNFLKPPALDETLAKHEIANLITSHKIPAESLEEIGTYRPESTTIVVRMK